MFKVTPQNHSLQYLQVASPPPLQRAYRNGFALTMDKGAAAGKLRSISFIKDGNHDSRTHANKHSGESFASGLPEPKRQKPDAGSKKYAMVTLQILQDYLTIARERRRHDEIAIDDFMTSNKLDPANSIYFSRHALTPEGRILLFWLENAEYANGLPDEEREAFFVSTADLTHDSGKASLAGARNLECALAWHYLPEAKKMTIMEFCVVNSLSCSSMQKFFFGGGVLHSNTERRIVTRFGHDSEYVKSEARQALQDDNEHAYISAAGKVTPNWKARLLDLQFHGVMKRTQAMPVTPPGI